MSESTHLDDVAYKDPNHFAVHNAEREQINWLTLRAGSLAGPLGRSRYKLATDPANWKVVLGIDSTSDINVGASILYMALRNLHTQPGEALAGVNPAKIFSGGNNGLTLGEWFSDPDSETWVYNRNDLVTQDPDLWVLSALFNDIRQGELGTTVAAIVPAGVALMETVIEWAQETLPGMDILLRMPNPMLTTDVGGAHYVKDAPGGNINPAGLAQIYSTALRLIYLSLEGRYPNVDVIDMQALLFGTRSVASHPLIADQLHPSGLVSGDTDAVVPVGGGYTAIAQALADRIGFARNAFSPDQVTRVRHEFIVYDAPVAGTVQLISRDYNTPAPQAPVQTSDNLYVNGLAGPISLAAATINRNVGVNVLQISGLGGTDFTTSVGKTATIAGNHAPPTTGDRQVTYVDLPSIAAGADGYYDCYVAGVVRGQTSVIMAPGASFVATAGMRYLNAWVTANDTVRVYVRNTTGGAVDVGGDNWDAWVVH